MLVSPFSPPLRRPVGTMMNEAAPCPLARTQPTWKRGEGGKEGEAAREGQANRADRVSSQEPKV